MRRTVGAIVVVEVAVEMEVEVEVVVEMVEVTKGKGEAVGQGNLRRIRRRMVVHLRPRNHRRPRPVGGG